MIVALTSLEAELVELWARRVLAKGGWATTHLTHTDVAQAIRVGFTGELAVAKWLNIYPSLAVWGSGAHEFSDLRLNGDRIEVKTVQRIGDLIIRRDAKAGEAEIYVACLLMDACHVEVCGWAYGREAVCPRRLAMPGRTGTTAYITRRRELRQPVDLLMRTIGI